MGDLTTVAAVKRQLNFNDTTTGTLTDDQLIADYVTQASAHIEAYCDRSFSSSIGTLFYSVCPPDVYGRQLYFGDDVLGVASVTQDDGTVVSPTDYALLPLNANPKYALIRTDGASWTYSINRVAAITVVATIGYCTESDRPQDITLAATKYAAWLYQNRNNDGQTIAVADGAISVPAQLPDFVIRILDSGRYVKDVMYP